MIFGEQFDKQLAAGSPGAGRQEAQRMLMGVINASIEEFARRENLGREEAADFLSEVEIRDLVLEFNEVLEAREIEPEKTLDELLREAVNSRLDKPGGRITGPRARKTPRSYPRLRRFFGLRSSQRSTVRAGKYTIRSQRKTMTRKATPAPANCKSSVCNTSPTYDEK